MPPSDPTAPPVASASETKTPFAFKLGAAKFKSVNAIADGTSPPIDVKLILRENVARANADGLNDLAPAPTRSTRRRRDYWFLLIAINLFLGLLAVIAGPASPILFVSALSGMVFLSGAITWVMWFVMDNY